MKPLEDIRVNFHHRPITSGAEVRYLKRLNIDFEVYLPSRGMNLQRDLVWSLEQKRELVWSVLLGRHLPPLALINTIDKNDHEKDLWLVIDGKQRLSTIFDFIDNKFTLLVEGSEYLFNDLPKDYRDCISYCHLTYWAINEIHLGQVTDDDKVAWFKFINFAGTPQDLAHLANLNK